MGGRGFGKRGENERRKSGVRVDVVGHVASKGPEGLEHVLKDL